ncbi:acyl-CoA dehydrogenase [Curtobacterium sp. SGAir0471]|uniref:acyl-CoA dehydrogenase n=1 Tax=Curtobacterium sp. SGAir0471 TaxID=2070337 RepID=UPI0010CCC91C|nr:acyl-CoA dehydrogenase [Curtobacterium sp. SGAir0471]QCR44406.1 acyl-CoA dehydrogenase [Curtobacterium sp. SGAir0471]
MSGQSSAPASRRTKVAALVAGGALVVGGVGYTLASWTDTEWVFGGNGTGGPGIATSTFEVEQNVTGALDTGWTQAETAPGQEMTFTPDAIALSPGDTTYASVVLRTTQDSIAGTVRLSAVRSMPVASGPANAGLLWEALDVRVAATAPQTACAASTFATATVVADGPLATSVASTAQRLGAANTSPQRYCFEISLPQTPRMPTGVPVEALQGLAVTPAWEFSAESE